MSYWSKLSNNFKDTKIYEKLNSVNWSYHLDKIKDRWLYIVGAIFIIFLPWMADWPIIGNTIQNAHEIDLLPAGDSLPQGRGFLTSILIKCAIFAIFAASWDLLSGYSGQVSFGHALYLGIGSYISTFYLIGLSLKIPILGETQIFSGIGTKFLSVGSVNVDLNALTAIIVGALVASLFAIIIGTVSLRLRGPYFALVTLVLPLIALLLVRGLWEDKTLGNLGIPVNAKLVQASGDYLSDKQNEYTAVLLFLFISLLIMVQLARSRFGIVLQSIREDETAASASGINVALYKVVVYGISAFFAGIAGGLYTQSVGNSSPSLFGMTKSFEVIIWSVFGGIGSITGAVVGTFVLFFSMNIYLDDAFIEVPTLENLALGIILLLVLKYQPLGLVRANKRFRNGVLFGMLFAIFLSFYESGKIVSLLSDKFSPSKLLIDNFGEGGLFGYIDVVHPNGRFLIYLIIGVVLGYFGHNVIRFLRLRFWGVWPSIGNYEPPK